MRMQLAKDRLDIGLTTGDPAMIDFMRDDAGLGDPECLPIAAGMNQFRFDVDGSVVKVNVVDEFSARARSGYSRVVVAGTRWEGRRDLTGPDHVAITTGPPGTDGVDQLGIELRVPDADVAAGYYRESLGWRVDGSIVTVGASRVLLVEDPAAPQDVPRGTSGWTYATVQIMNCDHETEAAVSHGARLVQEAMTLGDVARFSMVADPWGNQLEISQRASLTGPLP